MKKLVFLLLPLAAQAQRPGAQNEDLILIYSCAILVFLALAYSGKAIAFFKKYLHKVSH